MYLSKILVNTGDNPDRPRPGRLWLRNLYHVHQRLSMGFPMAQRKTSDPHFLKPFSPEDFGQHVHVPRAEDSGFLYRIDTIPGGSVIILVLSALDPDWEYAFHNAEHLLAAKCESRSHNLQLSQGASYRFRLRANPVTNDWKRKGKDGRGKRVFVGLENDQRDWLKKKLADAGAELLDEPPLFLKPENQKLRKSPNKDIPPITFRSVLFEGTLRVNEPTALQQAITQGIGPAKAFGCGLLSLAPA